MAGKLVVRPVSVLVLAALRLCCLGLALHQSSPGLILASAQPPPRSTSERRPQFAGDDACLPCHKDQSLSYQHTAHHLTSQLPSGRSILGSFQPDKNILLISNPEKTSEEPRLSFRMDATPNGFYQTAIAELNDKKLTRTERIDIVLGSGVRGQTYLFWKDSHLFELPVSFWTAGSQWINSPGYRDGTANFARRVDPRCLECHATYIKALLDDPQTNFYDPSSLVPGISCETCHGPGAAHVTEQRKGSPALDPKLKKGILNPATFSRDRQIDQCALCHNGAQREELAPAFSYAPGRELDQYLAPSTIDSADHPDVHGNQVGLLKRSRCFLSSPTMTCSTCHDIHAPERTAATYSTKCLSCHKWQSCGASRQLGPTIVHECIGCHMPLQQTNAIVSQTAGRVIQAAVRTHWIKVYPQDGSVDSIQR